MKQELLKKLDGHVLNMSSSTTLKTSQKRNDDNINYGLEPELIVKEKREELAPLELMIKALVTELFKRRKEKLHFEFPNGRIVDFLEVTEEWWNDIDTNF